MRLLLPVLLILVAAAPASASPRYDVDGPRSLHVGERVRFTVTGAKPGERVEVSLAPTINRGGNCCGVMVRGAQATRTASRSCASAGRGPTTTARIGSAGSRARRPT